MKGDSAGSIRWLPLTKEPVVADAGERHATKNPGMRGKPKRATVVCHPVSHGGSSASGTRPTTATRTVQDTDTSDVTRGTGPELAQGVIQPSSSDDTGDAVAMEGENADETSAGDSNPSEPYSRRRITTKREPREARDEQSAVTGLHVPRWMSRKTTPQGPCGCCHHARGIGRSREKTMRVANIENNSLNWVSISQAGALDMTNCDFSERRARDERRHIIGSSEPDVIIGSDKD